MFLKQLSLINFKNFEQSDIEFCSKINCFVGNNGAGKTNILDSIYYLSFCKSNFNSIDTENINYDRDFFVIQGNYNINEENEVIYCSVKRNYKKQFKRNKKDYQRLADHIGLIPLVMISPEDINLISGNSDERRKFIDSVISQFNKDYLNSLIAYNKALKNRNILLKNFLEKRTIDEITFDFLNEILINNGNKIFNYRKEFIASIIPVFQKFYNNISENSDVIDLKYKSQLYDKEFKLGLIDNIEKDKIIGYTSFGTHKDDLELLLSNHSIKKVGSQGQQKTYLIALKFAQFDFVKKINDSKPIILLDDIFDKLDPNRVSQIVKIISENEFGQVFITDKSLESIELILKRINAEHKIFIVKNSVIINNEKI